MYDVIIIGGGPAGLTAATYARRAGLTALVLEAKVCGGQIINSQEVDNFPTRIRVSGYELAYEWQQQAEGFGAEFKYAEVTGIELDGDVKLVKTAKETFESKTVIIANGVEHRRLEVPGADTYYGRGISTCATCDGAFFRGKKVVVVGGGNTAFEDAIYLTGLCEKVWLINRRGEFRAEPKLVETLRGRENAEILTPYVPYEVLGDTRVSGFKIKNTATDEITELPVAGIFTAIGMIPSNDRFEGVLELDGGYIVTDENCRTSTPGIFAAGDTRIKTLRQLVTAASDGAIAANAAAAYINSLG